MTAYYNEFDPYAAQWLRNPRLGRGRLVCSSSCREGGDRSGIAPKQVRAICNSMMSARRLAFRRRAYAPLRELGFHRSSDTPSGRMGLFGRSESGCRPGAFSPSFWRDRSLLAAGAVHGMCGLILRCLLAGKLPSKATYLLGQARYQRSPRIFGRHGSAPARSARTCGAISLCTSQNSTGGGYVTPAFQCRTQRTSAESSSRYCATSSDGRR